MSSHGTKDALSKRVQRHFQLALVLTFCMSPLQSATLERLSLNDLILKSTSIVRGKVTGSHAAWSGPVIYTHYTIQVTEVLKGSAQSSTYVVVPGGTVDRLRQSFPGAPEFKPGDEFVFFLWTSPSGLTQIMGLTQGLFALAPGGTGDFVVTRAASTELMLDPLTGQPVKDQTVVMHLSDLKSQITSAVHRGGSR